MCFECVLIQKIQKTRSKAHSKDKAQRKKRMCPEAKKEAKKERSKERKERLCLPRGKERRECVWPLVSFPLVVRRYKDVCACVTNGAGVTGLKGDIRTYMHV